MQVKIVHAADFHLERSFKGLEEGKADLRREELKQAFLRVIDLAAKERAQLLLLAGDLFEHDQASRELMHFLNQAFRKLQARVFIAPGNHDPGLPGSPYLSYPWSENVHIFREEFSAVALDDLGCVVYGLGFGHFAIKEPLLRKFRVADNSKLNVVVIHGEDTSCSAAGGHANYLPFTIDDLARAGADYYALGHNHRQRVVWEDQGVIRAWYPGSPEPLGYDEEGEQHGVILGTLAKGKHDVQFVRLNQRTYRTVHITCSGQEFQEELVELAVEKIPEQERQRDFFRLVFTGEVDANLEFIQPSMMAKLEPYFFHCRVENATVPRYDLTAFAPGTLRGMFAAKMQAMLERAATEEEREILRQSLYAGLDALNLGKVVER